MALLTTLLYIIFVLSAIVLITVILIQEGKGGGLGSALGGAGQETFGVGASGINKFTGIVAGIFLACAIGIHVANRTGAHSSVIGNPELDAPAVDLGAGAPPASGGQDEGK